AAGGRCDEPQWKGVCGGFAMTPSGRQSTVMTIGALSRRTGVPVKALREYEDLGLIYTVGRSAGNYRLFDEEALWCVAVIGTLRGAGSDRGGDGGFGRRLPAAPGRADRPSAGEGAAYGAGPHREPDCRAP